MVTKTEKRIGASRAGPGLQFEILDDPIERVVELFTKDTTLEERALLLAFREIGPVNNKLADRIVAEIAGSFIGVKESEATDDKTITYISGILAGLAISQD